MTSPYTPTEKLFGFFRACAGLALHIWIAKVHEPMKETHYLPYEHTNCSVTGSVKNRLKSPHFLSKYDVPAVHGQRLEKDADMAQTVQGC